MTKESSADVFEVLKNIVLACEANGLRDLPFVRDGRRLVDNRLPEPVSSLVKELRVAADEEEAGNVQQDHYHSELLRSAAGILEAATLPSVAVGWETPEEWEMEQQMFHACGREDVPEDVQLLVAKLWKQYCLAAEPKQGEQVTQI